MNTNTVFWLQNSQSKLDRELLAILNKVKNSTYVRGSNSQYALCDEFFVFESIKEQVKREASPIIVDVPFDCIPYSLSKLDEKYTPFFAKIEGYIPLCERGTKKIIFIRGDNSDAGKEYLANLLTTYDGYSEGVIARSPEGVALHKSQRTVIFSGDISYQNVLLFCEEAYRQGFAYAVSINCTSHPDDGWNDNFFEKIQQLCFSRFSCRSEMF